MLLGSDGQLLSQGTFSARGALSGAFLVDATQAVLLARLLNVTAATSGPKLVVVDKPGYFALPAGAAELVLQVISERNGRASMILMTNLPFGEWTKVFPDARLAKAVVDRLTDPADIIDIGAGDDQRHAGLPEDRGSLGSSAAGGVRRMLPAIS